MAKISKANTEFVTVQRPVVEYYYRVIRPRYPDSILEVNPFADFYTSAKIQGMNAMAWAMIQAKSAGWERGKPDIVITQNIVIDRSMYNGVALELKREGEKIFKKDGSLYADKHLQEQQVWLNRYKKQGYISGFSIGLDETLNRLKYYFNL